MIRINIKVNKYNNPYSDDDPVRLKIGQKIEFIFPDGASELVLNVNEREAASITGGTACGACPFYSYDHCPTWGDQGDLSMCSCNGYMVKAGSVLECL